MNPQEQTNFSFKRILLIGGAFASYTIGAGFATGQEILQFFGSWGHPLQYVAILVSLLITVYYTSSCYRTGQRMNFDNQSDCFRYYCGPYIAWIFDIFALALVFGLLISMFSGVGTAVNQYFDLPKVSGAVMVGIAAALVVCAGLRIVEQVLGYLGFVIIGYVIIISLVAMFRSPLSLQESTQNLLSYVQTGDVLQAGFLGRWHNVWVGAMTYPGLCLICSVPFLTALGRNTRGRAEGISSGIFSGLFLHSGVLLGVTAILLYIDQIVQGRGQIPILSLIQIIQPNVAWTFAVVLIVGIFTNIIGYLWMLSGRFFEDKSKGQRIMVIGLVAVGVIGGTILPFSQIVNLLYPFAGLVGIILMVFMTIKDIRGDDTVREISKQG